VAWGQQQSEDILLDSVTQVHYGQTVRRGTLWLGDSNNRGGYTT